MFAIPFVGNFLERKIKLKSLGLNDWCDRLHFSVTAWMLTFCAVLIGGKQHFGNPITCMIPAEQDNMRTWSSYYNQYCFVHGTFRMNFNGTFPNQDERKAIKDDGGDINYYQWVPFFFAVQLFFFLLPYFSWKIMQSLVSLDMSVAVAESVSVRSELDRTKRQEKLERLVGFLFDHFQYRKRAMRGLFASISRQPAIALFCYVLSKLFYITNDIAQLLLICRFLDISLFEFRYDQIFMLLSSNDNEKKAFAARYFPRTVWCDVERIDLGQSKMNTFQCMISLNFINEKIFVFFWCWIQLLIVFAVMNLASLIVRMSVRTRRENVVTAYIKELQDDYCAVSGRRNVEMFVHEFLGSDGVLLIQFIADKAGELVARDVVVALWNRYAEARGILTKEHQPKWKGIEEPRDLNGNDYADVPRARRPTTGSH